MTTLADLYEEVDSKVLTIRAVVDGISLPIPPRSAEWSFRRSVVPTLRFTISNPPPAFVVEGAKVNLFVGFDGLVAPVFAGQIESVTLTHEGCQVHCTGMSRALDIPYRRQVVTIDNTSATVAVTSLLTAAGLTYYFVDLPAWQIGTPDVVSIEFQSYAEAVNLIAEVDGSPWWEMPDGQVRVELRDPIPAASWFREYFSGQLTGTTYSQPSEVTNAAARPRIRGASLLKLLNLVRNRVTVRGRTDPDVGDPFEATAQALSPWVTTPPTYIDFYLNNELLQSQTKVTETAVRHLGLQNRLQHQLQLSIDGDPEIFVGATVKVIDPNYTGISARFVVEGYTSRLADTDFSTTLDLRGGLGAGTTPQVAPVAAFIWKTDQSLKLNQVIPASAGIVFSFDGGPSKDFDGQIVSYAWSDTEGNVGSGRFFTVAYNPATVTSVTVTLTVTDNDGLTDSISRTITIEESSADDPLAAAVIAVAAENWGLLSIDGGMTWIDKAAAADLLLSGPVIAVSLNTGPGAWGFFPGLPTAPVEDMRQVMFGAGFSDLSFSDDDLDSVVSLLAITVNHVRPRSVAGGVPALFDVRSFGNIAPAFAPGQSPRLYCWLAGLDGGQVGIYVCDQRDGGDPMSLNSWGGGRLDLAYNAYPVRRVKPFIGAIGGDTAVPDSVWRIMSFNNFNVSWQDGSKEPFSISINFAAVKPNIDGALLAAILAAGAGHAAVDALFAPQIAPPKVRPIILFESGVEPRCWVADDLYDHTWSPVTGLPVGVNGVCLATGTTAADGTRDNFLVVLANGIVYSVDNTTLVATALDTAPSLLNDLRWENGFENVYIGAADDGVVKSIDGCVNVDYIRPHAVLGITWPATADARRIDWIAQPPSSSPSGKLYVAARQTVGTNAYYGFNGADWVQKATPTPVSTQNLRRLEAEVLAHGIGSPTDPAVTAPRASLDNGESWSDLTHPSAGSQPRMLAIDANNRWWAIVHDTVPVPDESRIYYSDDQGSSWTLARTVSGITQTGHIAPHPTDGNKLVASWATGAGAIRIEVSTDGGATWTTQSPAGGSPTIEPCLLRLSTGRLIVAYARTGANGHKIDICDDIETGAPPTLTNKVSVGGYSGARPLIKQAGINGPIFVYFKRTALSQGTLYRSLNQGDSFELCGGDLPDGGLATIGFAGMAYDIATDTFFFQQSNGPTWRLTTAATRDITAVVEADWEQIGTVSTGSGINGNDVLALKS